MLSIRNYKCLSCGMSFTLSDGVICLPSAGVECKYCKSKKTVEVPGGPGGITDVIKSILGK